MIAFVRHGQTTMNRDGRLQGRIDAPLSELGEQQAAALGAAFATVPVKRVLSSPLQRAAVTAAAIAHVHDLEVEVDDRLIELDYGDWDGLRLRDVAPEAWAAWRHDPAFQVPSGERLTDVTARIASLFADVLGEDEVIAVSHVSPIKVGVCLALGVDERASWNMHLDLASVTRVGARAGVPYLISYNDITPGSARLTTPR